MVGGKKSEVTYTPSKPDSLAIVLPEQTEAIAPIVSSYNERIRPVLDAVENLRRLNIAKEGIQLPTIVVVGDQSSGKSSVLESLAGISLPRGQGLLEKVTADDVNIGLGYVCVRNRIGDETYEEARMEEQKLFETHPLLSQVDKSIVGIPMLAQKLVQVQAMIISKTLPGIVKKINEKLANNLYELEKLPVNLASVANAMTAFMRIIGLSKESLRKLLIRGEFDEYSEDKNLHCTARLVEMLDSFSSDLWTCDHSDPTKNFMEDEIKVFEESRLIALPNFVQRTVFLTILQRKVSGIARKPREYVEDVWKYLENVVITVLMRHSRDYHQLQMSTKRAGEALIAKKMQSSIKYVKEAIEMENYTDYTCYPEYLTEYNKLISQQEQFLKQVLENAWKPSTVNRKGVGIVDVDHLRKYSSSMLNQAFDMKVRMISYWKIVQRRLIDTIALHLMLSINHLVDKDLDKAIVNDFLSPTGAGIERLLEESPSISGKREKLHRSVKVLRESKEIVVNIMDRIASYGDV
ncbi:hypothetical protein VNO77_01218 [Canavalia gladiata]|uniref:GED domain-containing protein n=1 Tax=Canavalia gladiata TaxID=3824 RepID=A0AAN9MQT5_CANGL